MNEKYKIETVEELEKYMGKLIVTHHIPRGQGYKESLRILKKILKTEKGILGSQIYGAFILPIFDNGTTDYSFKNYSYPLYSSCVDYARLPTQKEKHQFMEKYSKYKFKNKKLTYNT